MNNIPLVIIHAGEQPWFKKILELNMRTNENLLLVGDNQSLPCKQFFHIRDFQNERRRFDPLYVHLNVTPQPYELLCISRWFILLELMKKQNINICFYADSDILMFSDIDSEWKKYNNCALTLVHGCCGASSFFTRNGLQEFCDFVVNVYNNKNGYDFEKISSHYHIRRKHGLGGGVCDMTLFQYYAYEHHSDIGEMMHVINDSTYDHSINAADGYEFNGQKVFNFRNKKPYCKNIRLNRDILFNCIHLQGGGVEDKNKVFSIEKYIT
ncbi:MAG: hypothetical protein AABY32_02350 [Nanoarchaeota archaeon]